MLPAAAMKTFEIAAPLASHWRPASCAEVECQHYIHGWMTTVLPGSDDETLIRQSGRAFLPHSETMPDGFVRYTFPPGQPCFRAATHRAPLEREPLFTLRGGDWRGNPRGLAAQTYDRAYQWVDDFATHQQRLADRLNRG
jgi:hypothetical protein